MPSGAQSEPRQADSATNLERGQRPIRILLLEDSIEDVRLLRRALTAGLSYELTHTDTREAFVAALEGTPPDVILSDYVLPAFNGLEALELARARWPEVPFVFVSGGVGEEIAVQALKRGAADFLLKDRLATLPHAVVRALERASERAARAQAQHQAGLRLARLVQLRELGAAIGDSLEVHEVERTLVAWVRAAFNATAAALVRTEGSSSLPSTALVALSNGSARDWVPIEVDPTIYERLAEPPGTLSLAGSELHSRVRLRLHHELAIVPNAYMVTALASRGASLGHLHVFWAASRAVSDEELEFASNVSRIGATALENARLFARVRDEARISSGLLHLETWLGLAPGVIAVCEAAVKIVPQILPHCRAFVWLWDSVRGAASPVAAPPGLPAERLAWFVDVAATDNDDLREAIQGREMVLLASPGADSIQSADRNLPRVAIVPLMGGDEALGVLRIERTDEVPFNRRDQELMRAAAQRIGMAIRGEQTRERETRHVQRTELLNGIAHAVLLQETLPEMLQVTLTALEARLPARFSAAALFDRAAEAATVRAVGRASLAVAAHVGIIADRDVPLDANVLASLVRGRTSLLHARREPRSTWLSALATESGVEMVAVVPMRAGEDVLGVLLVGGGIGQTFGSAELEFLEAVSEHLALAVRQARLREALQSAVDELRDAQREVMRQERLRSLGQMASGIVHDMNNVLSPILGFTDLLLLTEPDLPERVKETLRIIRTSGHDMTQIVSRMREFYRKREDAAMLLDVDLARVIEQVVQLTRPRWKDMPQQRGITIQVTTSIDSGLAPFPGVETEIREALTNLLLNAVDSMPSGGGIQIRARPADGSPATVLEVEDTGTGMDEQTRERCLEPFFTTKGERGTGLGLAMVYGTMQRHEGSIEISSQLGAGTVVRLVFPVGSHEQVAARPIEPARPAPRETVSRPRRVLVIDDEAPVRELVRRVLSIDGHEVCLADGGKAGIDQFRAAHAAGTNFDVVITDLGMPDVDGRKVAKAVKETAPDTRVVMLTGWGKRLNAESGVPREVDLVLNKPPLIQELRAAIGGTDVVPPPAR